MEIMGVVAEKLQTNPEILKQDMISWLNSLKNQLIRKNGSYTDADLIKEEKRKDKLLDALWDGLLTKEEYSKKAESIDTKIEEIKAEIASNKSSIEDIAEIDRTLANIDEEIASYIDNNDHLKIDFILERLEKVEVYPDKVVVIIPLLGKGIEVNKNSVGSKGEMDQGKVRSQSC